MINKLIYSYCLENITFNKGDVIIDCGANIGELGLYFSQQNFDIQYIGFEPSIKEYLVCKINHPNSEILNIGLWDEKKELTFYVKSDTADSSLFEIEDFNNIETIQVERLDDVINQKQIKLIKLLKIDAEGAEPEILIGANKLLRKIKYISVDVGPERGLLQESTANETKEILFNNNFELINQNLERKSVLFENKNI
jgi:FkbM family methyltransferase